MKKAFFYGVVSLAVLFLVNLVSVQLFFNITAIISGICVLISALLLRTMIGVNTETGGGRGSYVQENKEDKHLGVKIGVFAIPYIITTLLTLI